jgi:aldehyde dehydrogenase (NAD+)
MDSKSFETNHETIQNTFFELKTNFRNNETRPVAHRKLVLQNLRRIIKDSEKDIAEALKKDLGLYSHTSYVTSVATLIGEIDHALKNLDSWTQSQNKETPMLLFPATTYVFNEPLGTVLIIGAWNYPFPTTIIPFISAIAAGNCAIIKPSENARECSRVMAKIVSQLDQRFYRCIEGGVETGKYLNKLKFDLIVFTGGTGVGRFVMKDAAENLVPVVLELGGKNPVIIDVTANIDLAVKRIASFKFMNSGQTCTNADFIFVHSALKDNFVASLVAKMKEFYGNDARTSRDYSKVVNEFHTKRVLKYLDGQQKKIVYQAGTPDPESCFVPPTIVMNPAMDSPLMKDEIFGPLLPIIEFSDFKEVMDYIHGEEKPLCIFYFGDIKSSNYNLVKNTTSSGGLMTNDIGINYLSYTTGFGGVGSSGIGRIRGFEGFKCCSNQKAIIERSRSGFLDIPVRYPPSTPATIRQFRFLLDNVGGRTFEEIIRSLRNYVFLPILALSIYMLFARGVISINLK